MNQFKKPLLLVVCLTSLYGILAIANLFSVQGQVNQTKGPEVFVAVDIYTGRVLWKKKLPEGAGKS